MQKRAVACQASNEGIVGALLEWAKDELAEIQGNISSRDPVTHLGIGIRFGMDNLKIDSENGLATEFSCRADLISIDIDPSPSTPAPTNPTPKISFEADIHRVDPTTGDMAYLLNDSADPTHLRSVEGALSWSANDGWDANCTLNDASFAGITNWTSDIPGELKLSDPNSSTLGPSPGFSEVLNIFLNSYNEGKPNTQIGFFMDILEALGLGSSGSVIEGETISWELLSSAIEVISADANSYIDQLFSSPTGGWNLASIGSASNNFNLLSIISNLIQDSNHIYTVGGSTELECLEMEFYLFENNAPFVLGINADGTIELSLKSFDILGIKLSLQIELDISQVLSLPSTVGVSGYLVVEIGNRNWGPLNSGLLRLEYQKGDVEPLNVSLELPGFEKVFDISAMDFIPISSIHQLYPPVNIADPLQSLKSLLSTVLPTLAIQSTIQLVIDKYLLSRMEGGTFLGDALEILGIARSIEGGNYACTSLVPLIQDPIEYLKDRFLNQGGGIRASRVIELSAALFEALDIDYHNEYILDENSSFSRLSATVMDIDIRGCPYAEFAIMESPDSTTADTLCFALRTPSDSPLEFVNDTLDPIINLEVEFRLTLNSDYSISLDGSGAKVKFFPLRLLSGSATWGKFTNPDAFASLDFEITDTGVSLLAEVSVNGVNSYEVRLLPTPMIGWGDLLTGLALDTVSELLPKLINKIIHKVRELNQTIGDALIGLLTNLSLWSASADSSDYYSGAPFNGLLITGPGSEYESLVSDPKAWLLNNLNNVLVSAVSSFLPAVASGITIITITSVDNITRITPNLPSSNILSNLSIDIGKDGSDNVGFWLTFNPTIDIPVPPPPAPATSSHSLNLLLQFGISTPDISPSWSANFRISTWLSDALISAPIIVKPCLTCGFSNGEFDISIGTNYDVALSSTLSSGGLPSFVDINGDSVAFWVRLLPSIDYGIPDLTALLTGAADFALGFVSEIEAVKTFLFTPLYVQNPQSKVPSDIQSWLQNISVPILILESLDIVAPAPNLENETFSFNDVPSIITAYSTPLQTLLSGLMNHTINSLDPVTGIYSDNEGDFQFDISILKQATVGGGEAIGLNFKFDDVNLKLSDALTLVLGFQKQDELNEWTLASKDLNSSEDNSKKRTDELSPGVTLQLLHWNDSTDVVTPHLSLEVGGLDLMLKRSNDKVLLDKFITLNTVGFAVSLDVNIVQEGIVNPSVEFGGQLVLDDFGIVLGGDGESTGGNGMAAGLLTGGEDGKDPVNPSFDIILSCYDGAPLDVAIKDGQAEFWFPINKDFGPLKIEQIGVRYFTKDNDGQDEHRLGILIDGSAEVAGFMAQVDDLMVSFPLLDPFDFKGGVDGNGTLGWEFDMAGLAISYDGPSFSIAGALRKETNYAYFPVDTPFASHLTVLTSPGQAPLPDGMTAAEALEYAEYQGLCTITTDTLGISAIGAFARVPNADGTGFVSVFVIAALNMPLGGPPFFFVTGLLGGLGLNRQLAIPDIADVPQHLFIQTLGGGLAEDPMGALNLIKSQFPIEHGSFWFAVGLKFTSFQIIESRAVLFIKIDTGFTIGIVALSAMSLPSKELNLGYIELALLAYYSSEEQVLWVQAQLTDASYIFSQSCRLTGGFALVTWFKTGEFVLSLGGYHPNFNAPDYYPVVPRIGFNWSPTSSVTVKGGVYFTLCTSAVMLGGGLDASYNKGKLSAGFRMGLDVLVVFDPFYYEFGMYIELYVKYKTWLKTFKASLGANLQIQGPKMRGTATISLAFISFTVKFGSNNQGSITAISGTQFLNKHVRQLPEADANDAPSSEWKNTDFMNANVLKGVARPASAKNDDGSDNDSLPTGEDDSDPWLLEPEFDFVLGHKFPATEMQFRRFAEVTSGDSFEDSTDSMDLGPMFKINQTSRIEIILMKKCQLCPSWHPFAEDWGHIADYHNCYSAEQKFDYAHQQGITVSSKESFFPETIWSYTAGTAGKPKAKTSAGEQLKFLSSYVISGRCYLEDSTDILNLEGKVEPCEMDHYIPLHESSGNTETFTHAWSGVMDKPLLDFESAISNDDSNEGLMSAIIKLMNDDDVDMVKQTYIKETAKANSSKTLKNYANLSKAGKGKPRASSGAKGSRRKNAKAGGNTR
ncbi:MAG TPA: hypothetical protein EYN17_06805 [Candidatus Poseidoniales archaeon]|nr:hypothetical protein [Candidatus Poseidoniales archaeon]